MLATKLRVRIKKPWEQCSGHGVEHLVTKGLQFKWLTRRYKVRKNRNENIKSNKRPWGSQAEDGNDHSPTYGILVWYLCKCQASRTFCRTCHVFLLVILSSHCTYHFCLFSLSSPYRSSFLPSSLLFFASLPNIFYPFHHSPSLRFSSRSVRSYNPDYLTASAFSIARPGWINIIDHISESPSNWCCVCVFAVVCMHEFTCVYTLNVCLDIDFMLLTVCTHWPVWI